MKIIKKFGCVHDIGGANFKNKNCWPGSRYVALNHRGDVYRCMTALRNKKDYLGNILGNVFEFYNVSRPCNYDCCYCAAPHLKNLIVVNEEYKNGGFS